MSPDTTQAREETLQSETAQVTAERANPESAAAAYAGFIDFWVRTPALPSTDLTEQAFQSLCRAFDASRAVTRTFYDMVQRQQTFVLATTGAVIAGLPSAMARQVDSTVARAGDAYSFNLRLLRRWTEALPETPRRTIMAG